MFYFVCYIFIALVSGDQITLCVGPLTCSVCLTQHLTLYLHLASASQYKWQNKLAAKQLDS